MLKLKKAYTHPFLFADKNKIPTKDPFLSYNNERVRSNRHHLYPRNRKDIPRTNKEEFILRLWEYKHFHGWNHLFQFRYFDEAGKKKCSELTIDEIITLMAISHPFIKRKVGSRPWKILFGNKSIEQAFELLCRMLYIKFRYRWTKRFPEQIKYAVLKAA